MEGKVFIFTLFDFTNMNMNRVCSVSKPHEIRNAHKQIRQYLVKTAQAKTRWIWISDITSGTRYKLASDDVGSTITDVLYLALTRSHILSCIYLLLCVESPYNGYSVYADLICACACACAFVCPRLQLQSNFSRYNILRKN